MHTTGKTTIIVALIFAFECFQGNCSAQEKSWEWAKTIYSSASNAGYSVVSDEEGNSFIAGSFVDTLHIGKTLISKGFCDIFIASFNNKGELRWLKQEGGTEADEAYGITIDKMGNIYATGYFSGTVNFSGKIIKSDGNRNFFLSKYDKNGNLQWVKNGKVSDEDYANHVCTDDSGNVFISGFFHGTLFAGKTECKSENNKNLFLMKFSTAGDLK